MVPLCCILVLNVLVMCPFSLYTKAKKNLALYCHQIKLFKQEIPLTACLLKYNLSRKSIRFIATDMNYVWTGMPNMTKCWSYLYESNTALDACQQSNQIKVNVFAPMLSIHLCLEQCQLLDKLKQHSKSKCKPIQMCLMQRFSIPIHYQY